MTHSKGDQLVVNRVKSIKTWAKQLGIPKRTLLAKAKEEKLDPAAYFAREIKKKKMHAIPAASKADTKVQFTLEEANKFLRAEKELSSKDLKELIKQHGFEGKFGKNNDALELDDDGFLQTIDFSMTEGILIFKSGVYDKLLGFMRAAQRPGVEAKLLNLEPNIQNEYGWLTKEK